MTKLKRRSDQDARSLTKKRVVVIVEQGRGAKGVCEDLLLGSAGHLAPVLTWSYAPQCLVVRA
jgi:hypothetical protein